MKHTIQTQIEEFEKIWDEEEMCIIGCPDEYCREIKFKDFLKTSLESVWNEAAQEIEERFYYGAIFKQNETCKKAAEKLTVHEMVSLTDACRDLIKNLKQTT